MHISLVFFESLVYITLYLCLVLLLLLSSSRLKSSSKERILTSSMHLAEIRKTPDVPESHGIRHTRQDKLHGTVPGRTGFCTHDEDCNVLQQSAVWNTRTPESQGRIQSPVSWRGSFLMKPQGGMQSLTDWMSDWVAGRSVHYHGVRERVMNIL